MKNILCLFMLSFFVINCSSQEEIKAISTKELKVLLAKENLQLLDVRSPKEIAAGAIKTAVFANYFEADFHHIAAKQLDKSKPVYLYCRSGNRSGKSAKILKEKGFDVYNVLGGYNQWEKEN
jgi:rhodanese-related sulfurtransferase